jgi:hypothetical protein
MDRMNDEFFRPRVLHCLIMSYSPIAFDKTAKPDPAQALSSHGQVSSSDSGLVSTAKRNLRSPTAGVPHSEERLPDSVATLVYPDAAKDPSTVSTSPEAKKRKWPFPGSTTALTVVRRLAM